MPQPKDNGEHRLVRPRTIRLLWLAFVVILAATVVAGLFIEQHGRFGIDGSIGFYAWYGFLGSVVLVFVSRALGFFLGRPDDHYDR